METLEKRGMRERQDGFTDQFVEDALIEDLFGAAAVVHLLIVILETCPVCAEVVEAVFVDVFETDFTWY